MHTPLSAGLKAPPDALAPTSDAPKPNTCGLCGGEDGHGKRTCPNLKAKSDSNWQAKPEASKTKPCSKCLGVGHWAQHHKDDKLQQRRAKGECKHWTRVGSCPAGDACEYNHDPGKKAYRAMWIAGSGCGVIVNGRRADSNTTPQRKAQRERERAAVRGHRVILMAGKELAVGEEATEKQKHLVAFGRKRASVATAIRADSATIRPRRA